jgi:hypothetical protein
MSRLLSVALALCATSALAQAQDRDLSKLLANCPLCLGDDMPLWQFEPAPSEPVDHYSPGALFRGPLFDCKGRGAAPSVAQHVCPPYVLRARGPGLSPSKIP